MHQVVKHLSFAVLLRPPSVLLYPPTRRYDLVEGGHGTTSILFQDVAVIRKRCCC